MHLLSESVFLASIWISLGKIATKFLLDPEVRSEEREKQLKFETGR